jgi:hypothetical protein
VYSFNIRRVVTYGYVNFKPFSSEYGYEIDITFLKKTSQNYNNNTAENALHLHAGGSGLRLALDNIIITL